MPKLKRRFGRVYFAGKQIAESQAFMEGDVEAGYQAADDILKARAGIRRRPQRAQRLRRP